MAARMLTVECFDENEGTKRKEKLRMRVLDEEYDSSLNLQFPKDLRTAGARFSVPEASISYDNNRFYRFAGGKEGEFLNQITRINGVEDDLYHLPLSGDEGGEDMGVSSPVRPNPPIKAKAKVQEEDEVENLVQPVGKQSKVKQPAAEPAAPKQARGRPRAQKDEDKLPAQTDKPTMQKRRADEPELGGERRGKKARS